MIFIVDDDSATRDSLRVLFDCGGLEARDFPSAQAFLEARQVADRGCVVLDIHMPGMTGIELLEHLRERGDNVPVIIVTGQPSAANDSRARCRRVRSPYWKSPSNRVRSLASFGVHWRSRRKMRMAIRPPRPRTCPDLATHDVPTILPMRTPSMPRDKDQGRGCRVCRRAIEQSPQLGATFAGNRKAEIAGGFSVSNWPSTKRSANRARSAILSAKSPATHSHAVVTLASLVSSRSKASARSAASRAFSA